MKKIFLLALSFTLSTTLLFAQGINREAPVIGFQNHDHDHNHIICLTSELMQTDEAITSLQAYRDWTSSDAYSDQILDTYSVGDQRTFNVRNSEGTGQSWDQIEFTLRAAGDLSYVWVEDDEFGPGKVTQEIADEMLENLENRTPNASFDPESGIVANNKQIFGNAPNVDGSGMVHMLIVDVRDGWEPGTGAGYIAGFFDPVDLNPDNANSNGKDIIYVDSYPHIYTDDRAPDARRALSTIAHEYQHLIHARYGRLNTFQNEGQSEWAELLNGYNGRGINYVFDSSEINRYIYQWRSGNDVLLDYQRASLLHGYIAEQVGVNNAGRITRAGNSQDAAYQQALTQSDLSVPELLAQFHVANLVNDTSIDQGQYGYNDPRRRNVKARGTAITYQPGINNASADRSLQFGGAEYIEFIGVQDFDISVNSDEGLYHYLVAYPVSGNPDVIPLQGSGQTLSEQYEKVVLATAFTNSSENVSANLRGNYSFSASWETVPIVQEVLSYYGPVEFFTTLPGDTESEQRIGRKKFAYRITPGFDGRIQNITFPINPRETGITGNTDLLVIFTEANASGNGFVPGQEIDTLVVPFQNLALGDNSLTAPDEWVVNEGGNYFIQFALADPTAGMIELLLDAGSDDETDSDYFPARTRIYIEPPSVDTEGWYVFGGDDLRHNNLIISVGISGLFTGEAEEPTAEVFADKQNYIVGERMELRAEATGQPAPTFQWYKDGNPIDGATNEVLVISTLRPTDAGSYSIVAVNFAGSVESESIEVEVSSANFRLAQNYPNPFNPTTNIQYVVPNTNQVSLRVYSSDGRLVRTLVDENQSQGIWEVQFDAGNLASGLYIYELQVGSRSTTKKMMLIR